VSVNQLDEIGYKIDIDTSVMKIREPGGVLLVKVKREENCLYLLHLKSMQSTCLAVCGHDDEVAWRWHERFGHFNMAGLQKLAREELVHGLPEIGQVGQLCEVCQAEKQRRTSFPTKAEYRVERHRELVHGDLCSSISPVTPRGKPEQHATYAYHSSPRTPGIRFMWAVLLRVNLSLAPTKSK
jgi:hypothetical protein